MKQQQVHILLHDGEEQHRGTYNECWMHLLKVQSSSTHHAMKYEGWDIVLEQSLIDAEYRIYPA